MTAVKRMTAGTSMRGRETRRRLGRLRQAGALAVVLVGVWTGTASAAVWTGETHGSRERSSRLVSGGTSWRGSLSLTTDRSGRVRGEAVVAYEPRIDLTGLTNAIAYIRNYVGTGLGLLGPFGGAVSGVGLSQIIGPSVSFDPATAIRVSPVSGSLRGERLVLRLDREPESVPYRTRLVLATGSEPLGDGRQRLPDPLRGPGDVNGRIAVSTAAGRSKEDGVTQQDNSYWMVTRVG